MKIIEWIKKRLFNIKLTLGTIEKCTKCEKHFWYNGLAYYDTLYHKKEGNYGGIICRQCTEKTHLKRQWKEILRLFKYDFCQECDAYNSDDTKEEYWIEGKFNWCRASQVDWLDEEKCPIYLVLKKESEV
jgi:hypothetical protein